MGQYHIELESFEKAVLPIFSTTSSPEIIVLDEIGKMELLSDAFYSGVQKIFDQKGGPLILATVPVAKNGRALQVVCNLESRSDCSVYKVRHCTVMCKNINKGTLITVFFHTNLQQCLLVYANTYLNS